MTQDEIDKLFPYLPAALAKKRKETPETFFASDFWARVPDAEKQRFINDLVTERYH